MAEIDESEVIGSDDEVRIQISKQIVKNIK